jgi:PAS domain S-box-containing protein
LKVLYAEDDPLDADLTRREFARSAPHIELDIVNSLRDAVARLNQAGYDVVLSDMNLPDGAGLDLLNRICEHGWNVAVVLITGAGDEETAVAALKVGADDYVVKRADYLARLPAMLTAALERHRAEADLHTRRLRVLYAEDNAIDIDLTRRHLERHAPYIQIAVVNTAAEVVKRLSESEPAGRCDVVLLDYRLPGSNALEVLKDLRRIPGFDLPIVLVTGHGNEEIAVQSLRLGASDYVVKSSDYLYKLPWALENAFHRAQVAREQAALRESEARYRLVSSLTSDYAYAIHIEPDGEWNLDWIAGAFTGITGYTEQELVSPGGWSALIHPDDMPTMQRRLDRLFAGTTDVTEFRMITKGGGVRWIRDYGQAEWNQDHTRVMRITGAGQDVTARRQADEEILKLNRDLERRARGLDAINTASQLITSTLDRQQVLRMVIDQVRRLLDAEGASVLLRDPTGDELIFNAVTGPGADQLVGKRVPITRGVAGWVMRQREPVIVTDTQHDPRFYGGSDAASGVTTRSLIAVPLRFKASVWGVAEAINKRTGIFDEHDLGLLEALASSAAIAIENAQLYSSMQDTARQLEQALRAKDEMIQNVSHELRTPLGIMYGYIDVMESGEMGPFTAEQEHAVQIIHRQSGRLRFMINRLLAMQTFEANLLKRVKVDPQAWLQEAVQTWQVRADRSGIRLVLDLPPALPHLLADPVFLNQVIENLLDNALKFSPRGTQVQVHAWTQDQQVMITLADQGVGIPSDELNKIFERFYQVDGSATRKFGGMGIGLALCRAIVEAHSGKIWAESNGQGSTFYIALPACID